MGAFHFLWFFLYWIAVFYENFWHLPKSPLQHPANEEPVYLHLHWSKLHKSKFYIHNQTLLYIWANNFFKWHSNLIRCSPFLLTFFWKILLKSSWKLILNGVRSELFMILPFENPVFAPHKRFYSSMSNNERGWNKL